MEEVEVKVKLLDSRATLPARATSGSAGADLRALLQEAVTIMPGETFLVHTGLSLQIPDGYAAFVFARSGLSTRQGLAPANKVGVIDADYRGEVMVSLFNHGSQPVVLSHGDRVAQLVILPVAAAVYTESMNLTQTQRGEGGFGSTGL